MGQQGFPATRRTLVAGLLLSAVVTTLAASGRDERPQPPGDAAGVMLLRDGKHWQTVRVATILRLPRVSFADPSGRPHDAVALTSLLDSVGVTSARAVVVSGAESAPLELAWARVLDPREQPALAVTSRETLKLVGLGGDLGDPQRWVRHVTTIDVRGAEFAIISSPLPAPSPVRARPTAITVIGADGTIGHISYDDLRKAASATLKRSGRVEPAAPLLAVLKSAGIPPTARLRASGGADTLELGKGAADPAAYGFFFNKRKAPVLTLLSAPARGGPRPEVRGVQTIEILR